MQGGRTALHVAVADGNYSAKIAEVLLNAGADPNLPDKVSGIFSSDACCCAPLRSRHGQDAYTKCPVQDGMTPAGLVLARLPGYKKDFDEAVINSQVRQQLLCFVTDNNTERQEC